MTNVKYAIGECPCCSSPLSNERLTRARFIWNKLVAKLSQTEQELEARELDASREEKTKRDETGVVGQRQKIDALEPKLVKNDVNDLLF